MTFTINPVQAMVMIYSHAKVQRQRSVSSEESGKKQMHGQTDRGNCITSRANGVSNKRSISNCSIITKQIKQTKKATNNTHLNNLQQATHHCTTLHVHRSPTITEFTYCTTDHKPATNKKDICLKFNITDISYRTSKFQH